jgi:hypothetical protein
MVADQHCGDCKLKSTSEWLFLKVRYCPSYFSCNSHWIWTVTYCAGNRQVRNYNWHQHDALQFYCFN